MELKLIVLAGAKQGLEIPLKKDKFLIGRAKECALRAASEAISRRHCAIVRAKGRWTARDLGSRNGTFINDRRITEETPLAVGDELRIGPLQFRVAPMAATVPVPTAAPAAPTAAAPAPAVATEKPRKQPPVKDVADAVQRSINKSEGSATEDDISRWLLGIPDPQGEATLSETRTIRLEETTLSRPVPASESATVEDVSAVASTSDEQANGGPASSPEPTETQKSGSWNFFRRGKSGPGKRKPGKLPPRPETTTKDSREAAADILREMTRRR
jgi:pSer/pThr/pTyr-binding forkhead associated (FHA) protein